MKRHRLAAPALVLALGCLFGAPALGEGTSAGPPPSGPPGAPAEDWPGFRGPRQDGTSLETGFLKRWPVEGLRELWRIDLGAGFSSFAASGNRLFTMTQRGGSQEAVCLDSGSGKILWSRRLEPEFRESQGGDGPRATPALGAGLVFVLGARGTLAALDATSGEPRWQLNVLEKFGGRNITWGLSGSPLLDGDHLIAPVGAPGAPVVAFQARTGEVAWRSESDGQGDLAGYSTPLRVERDGGPEIVVFQGRALVSLDPKSGKLLWKYPWKTSYDVNAAAPVYHEGKIFLSSGYNEGSVLLNLPGKGEAAPTEVWRSKVLRNKFSSSIYHQGHLYGFDENHLKCVEFETGRERWRQSRTGHGTLLLADGHLIVVSDRGDLFLAPADPERYREVARMETVLKGGVAWTAPVLHGGVLFLRNLEQAVALELRPSRVP
jgi:outer membrane protein assembly factor BamB